MSYNVLLRGILLFIVGRMLTFRSWRIVAANTSEKAVIQTHKPTALGFRECVQSPTEVFGGEGNEYMALRGGCFDDDDWCDCCCFCEAD